jgi:hypothetical protein
MEDGESRMAEEGSGFSAKTTKIAEITKPESF